MLSVFLMIRLVMTLDKPQFECDDEVISMEEALSAWSGTLEKVFPTRSGVEDKEINTGLYDTKDIYVCKHKIAKPSVFIPVFPGTNCEYDTAAFVPGSRC